MPVRGLVGHVPSLASCALAPQTVHGLVDVGALAGTLHAPPLPACSLGGPGHGLWTATDLVEFARAVGVIVRGLDKRDHALLDVTRIGVTVCGHTGPATGHVTVAGHETGHFSPLTVRGHGIGVCGLGGVARRLLLPPEITATLGRGWSPPLRSRAAPSPGPRLLCRASPGCSSACRGPMCSGMQSWALHFRLLASPVPGCCLVLLLR